MTAAYVLVKAELGMQNDAVAKIRKIKGVNSAHTVTGPYDLIIFVEGDSLEELGKTVISRIQNLKVVKDTMTCIVIESTI